VNGTSARFVAFEGLDGVGKTTLSASVTAALNGTTLAMPGFPRPVAHSVLTGLGPDATARCLFHAACARALGLQARSLADAGSHVVVYI
jgi:dTMP kinase